MSWITESNRMKHFGYAIPCALLFTILFVAGLAVGMEFKDLLMAEPGIGWISWLQCWAVWLGN